MKGKLILGVMVLLLALAVVPLSCGQPKGSPEVEESSNVHGVPALTDIEIRNPEIARQYGVPGYLEILPAASHETLYIDRGEMGNITILLHFVSYTTELKELQVEVDSHSFKSSAVRPYGILDNEGNIVERGALCLNLLVNYNPNGTITLRADETLPVTMTIRIPSDLPQNIYPTPLSIPLSAVGITADIPVIDDIGTKVIVHD